MIGKYFFVALGGALGAVARVALTAILPPPVFGIPLKILCVNVIGCFALGILTSISMLFWDASINARHFWVQGLLGGFTTFSAFSLEFGLLFQKGEYTASFFFMPVAALF